MADFLQNNSFHFIIAAVGQLGLLPAEAPANQLVVLSDLRVGHRFAEGALLAGLGAHEAVLPADSGALAPLAYLVFDFLLKLGLLQIVQQEMR